jgi:hypothetical protein
MNINKITDDLVFFLDKTNNMTEELIPILNDLGFVLTKDSKTESILINHSSLELKGEIQHNFMLGIVYSIFLYPSSSIYNEFKVKVKSLNNYTWSSGVARSQVTKNRIIFLKMFFKKIIEFKTNN